MKLTRSGLLVVTLLFPLIGQADEARMQVLRDAIGMRSFAGAPRIVQRLSITPDVILGSAADEIPEQLEAVREWNAQRRQPARNGITRSIGETMAVRFGGSTTRSRGVSAASAGGTTWGTSIHVKSAKRLRAHLEHVQLPAGTTLWVYGTSGEAIAFDAALVDGENGLWTPSVNGDTLYLEIEAPAGEPVSFEIREVLELLSARGVKTEDAPTCLNGQDVNCQPASEFPAMPLARRAVGQLEFISGGGGAVCTGTLINDSQSSNTPYFITANHCISTQSSASSLETYFDYAWVSCISDETDWLPPVRGSTLVTTSATSDVTLLRLASLPTNRVLLGWTTSPLANGTKLHRVSHPFPDGFEMQLPQMYSRSIVTTTASICPGYGRPNFIYSTALAGGEGGLYGGSSGSAAMISDNADDVKFVGQLLGACGPEPSAGCDRRNDVVDGSFATSYAVLRPYLSPTTGPVCTPNASTICLMDNRFSVSLTYDTGSAVKPMTAIKYTANTGLFWFADATNIEIILKMVNACSFNSRFWVFVGGTTDVGVVITVTDTKTGTVKTYKHTRGTNFGTITDTGAFATCP